MMKYNIWCFVTNITFEILCILDATPERKCQNTSIEIKKKIIDALETDPAKSLAKLAQEFSIDKIMLTKTSPQTILSDKDYCYNMRF